MALRRPRAGLAAGTLAFLCAVAASVLPAATSTLANPSVVFSSPGLKTVTLRACTSGGCTESQKTVLVLDPMPKITSATVSTAAAEVGQLVRLDASGTGRPALAFSWRIRRGEILVAILPGSTAYWPTGNLPVGVYNAVLRISNADGFVESAPLPVTLAANADTRLYTVPPCRLLDTRNTVTPLLAGVPRLVPTALGNCQVPLNARAVAVNVTVVGGTAAGSVKIYPGNHPEPTATMISFAAGRTRANFGILPLSTDGLGSLKATASLPLGGSVHLVIDVNGYFAP